MKKLLYLFSLVFFLSDCKKSANTSSSASQTPAAAPSNYLSASAYSSLIVEVQYIAGYQPDAASINNLKTFLENRLNKPGGVTITQTAISAGGKSSYSISDIQAIESAHRTKYNNGTTAAAYFFFADGDDAASTSGSQILGVTYSGSSVVIFEKTIKSLAGGLGQPSLATLETTVMEHEFGHLLGLVNNGTPMVTSHQDSQNGRHCNNTACLMYYSVETSDVIGNLTGGTVPSLDANCLSDLSHNGGK